MAKKPVAYLKKIPNLETLRAADEKALRKHYGKKQSAFAAQCVEGMYVLYTFVKPTYKLPKILDTYPVYVRPRCDAFSSKYTIVEVTDEDDNR